MNIDLQKGITYLVGLLAKESGLDFRTVSFDELENIDEIRGCFMVKLDILSSEMYSKYCLLTRYEVTVTYFAPLEDLEGIYPSDGPSVAMAGLADHLNKAFAREFKVGEHYFDIKDKAFFMDQNALDFSFRFNYRTAVGPPEDNRLNYPEANPFMPEGQEFIEDVTIKKDPRVIEG